MNEIRLLGTATSSQKNIVYCDMTIYKGWENEDEGTLKCCEKQTLRHEIVHAFLSESGLSHNSACAEMPWAKNEEMVDWIAIQGEKIYEAWRTAGAV